MSVTSFLSIIAVKFVSACAKSTLNSCFFDQISHGNSFYPPNFPELDADVCTHSMDSLLLAGSKWTGEIVLGLAVVKHKNIRCLNT